MTDARKDTHRCVPTSQPTNQPTSLISRPQIFLSTFGTHPGPPAFLFHSRVCIACSRNRLSTGDWRPFILVNQSYIPTYHTYPEILSATPTTYLHTYYPRGALPYPTFLSRLYNKLCLSTYLPTFGERACMAIVIVCTPATGSLAR